MSDIVLRFAESIRDAATRLHSLAAQTDYSDEVFERVQEIDYRLWGLLAILEDPQEMAALHWQKPRKESRP